MEQKRGKQVRLSREVFLAVKRAAAELDVPLQRYVEDVLKRHFQSGTSGKEVYTEPEAEQFTPEVALPGPFLRNCEDIYMASADEWAALSRVVAAVARGQESLRARDSDRPRLGPVIQPLPSEPKEDDKDKTG